MSDQDDLVERMAEAAAARLAEHCDSVVVIVTYARPAEGPEGPRTGIYKAGRGNFYAQQGSTAEWLRQSREQTDYPTPDPDDGDDDGEQWKGAEA